MNHLRSLYWIFAAAVLLIVTTVFSAPVQRQNGDSNLVYYENDRNETWYEFAYQTKDGQYREEQGFIDPVTGILTVKGSYSFEGTNGETYAYNYVADENGYQIVEKPATADLSGLIEPLTTPEKPAIFDKNVIISLLGGGKL
uniref:Uncharacterized protein n=1 Tax=Anopheles funestus TaxID=62324 RepID=A0A4Y0BGB3_ANOFN